MKKALLLFLFLAACLGDREPDVECFYGETYSYCYVNEYAYLTDAELFEEERRLDALFEEGEAETRAHAMEHAEVLYAELAGRGYEVWVEK